jgi:hypothetical protein
VEGRVRVKEMKILAKTLCSSFAFLFFFSACSVAPISNHITARTNGTGNSLASVGSTLELGNSGWLPSLKYSVGLSEDFDLGFQYEVIQYGAYGKYAFINNPEEGFSVAGLFGAGLSFEGFYGFGGGILSYRTQWFEPYLISRFNYVRYPSAKYDIASIGEFQVNPGTYRYFQHTLGFMVWPKEWVGAGVEASWFNTIHSPFVLVGRDRLIYSANLSFRF